MKTLIITLLISCFSIITKAQNTVSKNTSCNFLKNLKFTHGVDTVKVNGILLDLIQLPPFTTYEESFLKKRRINIHKIGSLINFQIKNCKKKFSVPLMVYADKDNFLNSDNLGISIVLTCIVLEGNSDYTDHSPYVIVIKVTPKMPIGSL